MLLVCSLFWFVLFWDIEAGYVSHSPELKSSREASIWVVGADFLRNADMSGLLAHFACFSELAWSKNSIFHMLACAIYFLTHALSAIYFCSFSIVRDSMLTLCDFREKAYTLEPVILCIFRHHFVVLVIFFAVELLVTV